MKMTDIMIDSLKDKGRLHSEFSINEGSILDFLNIFNEKIKITNPYNIISTRTLGSSFILNHPGLGWVGPLNAASLAVGSQPYLSDSRSALQTNELSSPNNKWIETFDGSRFNSGNSTADWTEVGSIHFTAAEIMSTESIYLGSRTLSSIRFVLEGSTTTNLNLEASPNGANNWEDTSAGSVSTVNFSNTGSDLRIRFTEDATGEAILNKVSAIYGFN